MCQDCDGKLRIFNKVAHQKYLMFMESSKMVAAKKAEDSSKDTAVILNELLADEEWLHQVRVYRERSECKGNMIPSSDAATVLYIYQFIAGHYK